MIFFCRVRPVFFVRCVESRFRLSGGPQKADVEMSSAGGGGGQRRETHKNLRSNALQIRKWQKKNEKKTLSAQQWLRDIFFWGGGLCPVLRSGLVLPSTRKSLLRIDENKKNKEKKRNTLSSASRWNSGASWYRFRKNPVLYRFFSLSLTAFFLLLLQAAGRPLAVPKCFTTVFPDFFWL